MYNRPPAQVGLDALLHSQFTKDWNLQLMVIGQLSALQEELHSSCGIVVSNGPFCNLAGASAWIIEGKDYLN